MADQTKEEARQRFVWKPGDLRLVRRAPVKQPDTGTKSMPDLHRKQLKIDAKLFGNQG